MARGNHSFTEQDIHSRFKAIVGHTVAEVDAAARLPPVYDGLPPMPLGASPPDPFGGASHDVGGLQPPVAFVIPLRCDFRMRGREVVDSLHRDAVGAAGTGTRAQDRGWESVP